MSKPVLPERPAGAHRPKPPRPWPPATAGTARGGGGETWGRGGAAVGTGARDDGGRGDDGEPESSYTLRLAPELRSVRQARLKLTELARTWGTAVDLLDDARVVLSELMSNGVLHARTDLGVVISQRADGLRLEVHDASPVPVLPPLGPDAPIILPPALPGAEHSGGNAGAPAGAPAATGRGLSIVAALSSTWGWFPDATGGKVVWAELGTSPAGDAGQAGTSVERAGFTVRPVRLIALPLRLVKASEDHLDDLFRELQMANLSSGAANTGPANTGPANTGPANTGPANTGPANTGPGGPEGARSTGALTAEQSPASVAVGNLAPMADHVKARVARMREPVRRSIWEAARRGDRLIDLNLLADSGMPRLFAMFAQLLRQSALAARHGYLLTEPPSAEVVAWREWLRCELVNQIAGKPPRACPFPVGEPDQLSGDGSAGWSGFSATAGPSGQQAATTMRAVLSQETAALSQETQKHQTAEVLPGYPDDPVIAEALAHLVQVLGARRAMLCLLAEDNETVRFGASVGFSPDVADYWQATSLSADLPASESIRTNRPVLFRTFAEFDTRYPVFLSTPSENDPALACVPLSDGTQSFGSLVIGFAQARDFSARDVGLLEQMASLLSESVTTRRALAGQREAAQRSARVQQAVEAILASPTREEVLRELAEAVVAHVCDGAAVHIVEGQRSARYFMCRHRDPERLAAAVALLQRRQQHQGEAEGGDDLVLECARTGQTLVVQVLSDEAMTAAALDEEDLGLLRRLGAGAAGVMAARSDERVVAVLSFANNVGRFISEGDLAALDHLSATTGMALARLGF